MKIALYAYGSLVSHPHSDNYGAGIQIAGDFTKTDIQLPLIFGRLSSEGTDKARFTLVPDAEHGVNTPLYSATVAPTNLNTALKQLREREGIPSTSPNINKFISYVKKGIPAANSSAQAIQVDGETWSYRMNGISEEKIKEMVRHLKTNQYDAGIITTFDRKGGNLAKRKATVASNPVVKANTKAYYNDLPQPVRKAHKASLKTLGVLN